MTDMQNDILIGIPTRNRPEYLAALLSSLMFQSTQNFDIMIADTAVEDEEFVSDSVLAMRFVTTLLETGHNVFIQEVPVCGKSEVVAVNYLLAEAHSREYKLFYKIDDDHVLPPNGLELLCKAHNEVNAEGPAIVSGVTPWMEPAWEGAASPSDNKRNISEVDKYITEVDPKTSEIRIGHFDRWRQPFVHETQLASAANFMMYPDIRLLWSDTGPSSLFADAVWFLQLRELLGYRMFFHLGVEAWHVAAHVGGVREGENSLFKKTSSWDRQRKRLFESVYRNLIGGKQ